MSDITTCKVVNKYNEDEVEELIICTEWTVYKLIILIIKAKEILLQGEIPKEDFNKYAKTFDKSLEEYLQEIQDILSGKRSDIEFFLKDDKFYWKRKKLVLGQVDIKSVIETRFLTGVTSTLIERYTNLEKESLETKKSNKELASTNAQLMKKLDEVIIMKSQLEDILYKKFTLLLNSKKDKIKELRKRIEGLEHKKDCIFDMMTDESDSESDVKNELNQNSSHKKLNNRKSNGQVEEEDIFRSAEKQEIPRRLKVSTVDEINRKNQTLKDSATCEAQIPSTSKLKKQSSDLGEDEETPDLFSEESECDFELKLDEEKIEDDSRFKTCAINQQDSDEEMF